MLAIRLHLFLNIVVSKLHLILNKKGDEFLVKKYQFKEV
jgi:hypothetical protein